MSFNVLYVEDDATDWDLINRQIIAYNSKRSPESERISIEWANSPSQMKQLLKPDTNLILTDVFFRDTKNKNINKLNAIIKCINEWAKTNKTDKTIPIIAYTGGPDGLNACLKLKRSLYDIWNKDSATPEYVAWRLSIISDKLSRFGPDSLLQRRISQIAQGASWHSFVLEMTKEYNSAWNEYDQIERAGNIVNNIADSFGIADECEIMWADMSKWEPLGRAAHSRIRGHCRHVINVFWLGYYLLHFDKGIRDWFRGCWPELLRKRPNAPKFENVDPLEAFSNIWFYAGLFHDIGACVEKIDKLYDCQEKLNILNKYAVIKKPEMSINNAKLADISSELLHEYDKRVRENISAILNADPSSCHLDHGIIGALYLIDIIKRESQKWYSREAAHAIALHNIIEHMNNDIIAWEDEPMGCLLLVCDQLQTWDRERGDYKLSEKDEPERAEMTFLKTTSHNGKPHVHIGIDYIAPEYLMLSEVHFKRVKNDLTQILRGKPNRALDKIKKPWPFSLSVKFYLSGEALNTGMNFE